MIRIVNKPDTRRKSTKNIQYTQILVTFFAKFLHFCIIYCIFAVDLTLTHIKY